MDPADAEAEIRRAQAGVTEIRKVTRRVESSIARAVRAQAHSRLVLRRAARALSVSERLDADVPD